MTNQSKVEHIQYLLKRYEELIERPGPHREHLLCAVSLEDFDTEYENILEEHKQAVQEFEINLELRAIELLRRIKATLAIPEELNHE